ncbi:MAG: hypothetical protein CMH41_01050 [Micrococcales bacterium]|jgi:hypothetical protein|nr:hypothetical protein [Micrococcales bacterium]
MAKVFVQGIAVVVAGVVALFLNRFLDLGTSSVVFGLLIGGAIGIARDGSALGRIGGFVLGLIAGIVFYGLRLAVFNDSFPGQILTLLILVALVTIVCGLTAGRMPLWSSMLGSALIVGAFEYSYENEIYYAQSLIVSNTTSALLPAALGILAGVIVGNFGRSSEDPPSTAQPAPTPEQPTVSLTKSEG